MIKKSAIALALALPLILSGCASSKTKVMNTSTAAPIKKVCVVLPEIYSKKASKDMGDIVVKVFTDNGYKVETIYSPMQAEEKKCSHYMKYSTKANKKYHKFFHLSFFEYVDKFGKFQRVAEASKKTKLDLEERYQEAYDIVDTTIKQMLGKQ